MAAHPEPESTQAVNLPQAMVDPRIYRAGLVLVVIAVIVFGFSLENPPGAATTTMNPPPANGLSASARLNTLAGLFPNRPPGSNADNQLAGYVATQFGADRGGFTVSKRFFWAQTADGTKRLETVTASRSGLTTGTIVVEADRDNSTAPGQVSLSGTAVLLKLAHDLSGETLNRSTLLVSTSGSIGAAGATQLARSLTNQPIDAVIVLGDMAAAHPSQPIVVPWSGSQAVAPELLRNTVATYVSSQAGLAVGGTSLAGQIAHLAVPLSVTEQAPFGPAGIPAVLLSLAGVRTPTAAKAISPAHVDALEAAVLLAVNALDTGPSVPAPSTYLILDGKLVPLWAVRLLVLALILPAIAATVDALARVRRRGHSMRRWLAWVLAGAVPFLVGAGVAALIGVTGLLPATPPGPVGAGGVRMGAAGAVALAVVGVVIVVAFLAVRPLCIRLATELGDDRRAPSTPAADGAAVALAVVLCLTAIVLWIVNPFAAALVVPALNLWLWLAQPSVRARRVVVAGLLVVGLVPGLLLAFYYAHSLGLSPLGLAWTGLLLIAGGGVGIGAVLAWCVALGCAASAVVMAARASTTSPAALPGPASATVRGPAGYAGPGSLGGTESALRGTMRR